VREMSIFVAASVLESYSRIGVSLVIVDWLIS
jgi:hypothetical protein